MMAKQLDGRWCDPKNINYFMDLFDQLEAHHKEFGEVTLDNNPLTEAQIEWLNEFLADFMIDVKVFVEAAAKVLADALTAMADGLRNIVESISRAQKDGRTRAYGAPAVAFQAPAIPTSSLGGYGLPEDLISGTPFAMPGVNVHNDGIVSQINRQLDSLQQPSVARRRRFE